MDAFQEWTDGNKSYNNGNGSGTVGTTSQSFTKKDCEDLAAAICLLAVVGVITQQNPDTIIVDVGYIISKTLTSHGIRVL